MDPHKVDIYREFVRWHALPPFEREREGIATQEEFAAHYKVNKDTLTRWKHRKDFQPQIDQLVNEWGFDRTPAVIESIYRSAIKGKSRSQSIWMKYFSRFDPKRDKKQEMIPLLREEDVRLVIQDLPEWRQTKYWEMLRDLHYDALFFLEQKGHMDMTEEAYNEMHKDSL